MITEAELLAKVPRGLYIDGQWVDAEGGATMTVNDPSTGEIIAEIASASVADAKKAMDAAANAQASWAATAPRVRGELLRKAWELVIERADEFALLMTLEMGKPLAESRGEVTYGAEFLRWFSEEAVRITGRFGENPEGTGHIVVSHQPVGPSFLITPWNFPLAMATRKIAPAIAAGCTSIIKPAALTPLTTMYFVKTLEDAGVPAGVVNVVPTADAGGWFDAATAHRATRMVSFTGSTEVGRILLRRCADRVLKVAMELGGNAPFVVFADADLEAAVDGAMVAKMRHSAETCTAANRFFVEAAIAADFTDRLAAAMAEVRVGRGTDEGVTCGPMINPAAIESIGALVGAGRRQECCVVVDSEADAVGHHGRKEKIGRFAGGVPIGVQPAQRRDIDRPQARRDWSAELRCPPAPVHSPH